MLALVLVGLTAVVLALEGARGSAAATTGRAPGRRPRGARPLAAGAGPRSPVRPRHRLFLVVPASCSASGSQRAIANDRGVECVERGALVLGASSLAAGLAVAAALPVRSSLFATRHGARAARAARLRRERAPRHRDRPLARLLRGALRARYQTLGLLVFAYVVRFLPQALAGSIGARRVDPRLEEAARGLGARRLPALVTVTVPLARSGMLAGARARLPEHDEGAPGDAAPAPDRLRDASDRDLEADAGRRLLAGCGARADAHPRRRPPCCTSSPPTVDPSGGSVS